MWGAFVDARVFPTNINNSIVVTLNHLSDGFGIPSSGPFARGMEAGGRVRSPGGWWVQQVTINASASNIIIITAVRQIIPIHIRYKNRQL
ncbi:Monocarboxylate transporter 12 [Anopheles sinensis]|uniref:Monocarboxylate transporter 12 n=1 Tax=Anopheles sinensis TaxID=74873 RepID=A0A084VDL9_ANOSI|nr:Monocarboxylate transporter 12 [Anopheles sinensis]